MSKNVPMKIGTTAPSWLAQHAEEDNSTEHLKQYRKLVRLKCVQGTGKAAAELKKLYGEGAVVLQPGGTLVAEAGQPFMFVPLMSYTEFCLWSDMKDPSKDRKAIIERTFDEANEVALKARDKNRRYEKYRVDGSEYVRTYVEHLVFPGVLYGGDLHMTPATLSFERGEFWNGTSFASSVLLRKSGTRTAPLWSQVWQFSSSTGGKHGNDQYTWWGFDPSTPSMEGMPNDGPYILEQEVLPFKTLAAELRKAKDENALVVDRSDADEDRENLVDGEESDEM